MNLSPSFDVLARPGGGWKLSLVDADGVEAGGGVYPAGLDGWTDAYDAGTEWLVDAQLVLLDQSVSVAAAVGAELAKTQRPPCVSIPLGNHGDNLRSVTK